MNARISSASAGGAPSRKAFTASMNSVSPRGKVADSALNHAVAIGSPFEPPALLRLPAAEAPVAHDDGRRVAVGRGGHYVEGRVWAFIARKLGLTDINVN